MQHSLAQICHKSCWHCIYHPLPAIVISERIDLWCDSQRYHHPNQPHQAFTQSATLGLYPVARKLLLISCPAEGRRLS